MSHKRIWAIARKEFFHLFRDIRSLIAAIGIPLVMMFLYCYSLSLDVNHIPTAVMDYNRTSLSRDLIDKFRSSGYFDIIGYVNNYREMQNKIDRGKAVLGLVIPYDYAKKLKNVYSQVPVQILLDGTDPQRATTAMGYSMLIAQNYSAELLKERLSALGFGNVTIPLDPRIHVWYNPALRSKNFIIPGLIALIMAILSAFLTALTISREWENNTMELLISTPVKSMEVIIGKLIPYYCVGILDILIIILAGRYVFDVPVKGSLLLLALFVLVFLLGVLSLGILVSASTRTQLLASQTAMMLTYLPSVLLSGFVFFIPGMPKFLQFLSFLFPARYFVSALKGIYLKAVDLTILWPQLLLLLLFDFIIISIAAKRFVKKLDTK